MIDLSQITEDLFFYKPVGVSNEDFIGSPYNTCPICDSNLHAVSYHDGYVPVTPVIQKKSYYPMLLPTLTSLPTMSYDTSAVVFVVSCNGCNNFKYKTSMSKNRIYSPMRKNMECYFKYENYVIFIDYSRDVISLILNDNVIIKNLEVVPELNFKDMSKTIDKIKSYALFL